MAMEISSNGGFSIAMLVDPGGFSQISVIWFPERVRFLCADFCWCVRSHLNPAFEDGFLKLTTFSWQGGTCDEINLPELEEKGSVSKELQPVGCWSHRILHATQNEQRVYPWKWMGFFQTIGPFLRRIFGPIFPGEKNHLDFGQLLLWYQVLWNWAHQKVLLRTSFGSSKGTCGRRFQDSCCRRFVPPTFSTQNVVGQELVHQFPIEKPQWYLGSEAICKKKSYRCSWCSQ